MTRYRLAAMCRHLTKAEIASTTGLCIEQIDYWLRVHKLLPRRSKRGLWPRPALGMTSQHRETVTLFARIYGVGRAAQFFGMSRESIDTCLRSDR